MTTSDNTPDSSTIQIPLSRGYVAIVSIEDEDLLSGGWYVYVSEQNKTQYAVKSISTPSNKRHSLRMHRVILSRMLGRDLLRSEIVDHKNRNGLDNRRENLRLTNRTGNARNVGIRKDSTSGYKGVSWCRREERWMVNIAVNSKGIYVGRFINIHDATRAYNVAALKHHGEFAYQNIIEEDNE